MLVKRSLINPKKSKMARPALRIVATESFDREVEFWNEETVKRIHSAHHSVSIPGALRPEVAEFLIEKYSTQKDVVFDPFSRDGVVSLQSRIMNRISLASDISPLGVFYSKSKLEPADLTEITLRLQMLNLRKPISIELYTQEFYPFFHLDTFRELVNLRSYLRENYDRVSKFIELLSLGLLHGHKLSFFSAYTSPTISVSSSEQEDSNRRRNQHPDYRAIVPRLLKKAAGVLQDANGSFYSDKKLHNVELADPRNLTAIGTGSVDLVVTQPLLPGKVYSSSESWLRLWFLGRSTQSAPKVHFSSLEVWDDFINETLVELARCAKNGSRAALVFVPVIVDGKVLYTASELVERVRCLVEQSLDKMWSVEGILRQRIKSTMKLNAVTARAVQENFPSEQVLILRHR